MTLGELLQQVADVRTLRPAANPPSGEMLAAPVAGLAHDSRQVGPGSIFVALRGQHADGMAYVPQALARGAVAVLGETAPPAGVSVPVFLVDDARLALAALAAAFFGHPSRELTVIGITGTNGKTTTSYLLAAMFERAGVRCGRIGTVSYRIGREEQAAGHTTPEADDLQCLLREMVEAGCGACVMEVSSHALALRRVDQMRFAAGVFTNLTRDHLDFHGDMEAYFQSKRRLFEMLPPGAVGVINRDDPRSQALAEAVTRRVTYGIDQPADVTAGPLSLSLEGLSFEVRTPRGPVRVESPLVGRPNAYNVLAAVATAMALDLPFTAVERGVADVAAVPGRFQIVSTVPNEVTVVVDYAHTDDALRNLLETARPLAAGRLITVFGCGGDRDRTKRPLMGAVAARLSDVVVITSDNPRSEDPERIIEQILRGITPTPDRTGGRGVPPRVPLCLTIPDRRAAIERAIREAQPGDLVLIAGKGHERYQIIGSRVLPFDDVEVAREALVRRTNSHVG